MAVMTLNILLTPFLSFFSLSAMKSFVRVVYLFIYVVLLRSLVTIHIVTGPFGMAGFGKNPS